MVRIVFSVLLFLLGAACSVANAQSPADSLLPVRGLSISAPVPANVDSFVTFIQKEAAPRGVNTLILLIDYRYQFKSHPELIDTLALSEADAKKIVQVCKQNGIQIIPQINCLGHQSWANKAGKLLAVYPQFDETPWIALPEKYQWPNPDNLYCKSYCPLHPDVHKVIFDVADELCDVFEAPAFHAGMDEVFYIAEPKCPRCGGRDPSELFAGEVRTLRNHMAEKGRGLWIWGDRLLDGKTTGLGMWEASYNNTYRAIDLIPKDVVICDWHYERPDKSAVYFAMKGFKVITCPWRKPEVAVTQVNDMVAFRQQATPAMKDRYMGVAGTVWSPVSHFFNGYYNKVPPQPATTTQPGETTMAPWLAFRAIYDRIQELTEPPKPAKKKK